MNLDDPEEFDLQGDILPGGGVASHEEQIEKERARLWFLMRSKFMKHCRKSNRRVFRDYMAEWWRRLVCMGQIDQFKEGVLKAKRDCTDENFCHMNKLHNLLRTSGIRNADVRLNIIKMLLDPTMASLFCPNGHDESSLHSSRSPSVLPYTTPKRLGSNDGVRKEVWSSQRLSFENDRREFDEGPSVLSIYHHLKGLPTYTDYESTNLKLKRQDPFPLNMDRRIQMQGATSACFIYEMCGMMRTNEVVADNAINIFLRFLDQYLKNTVEINRKLGGMDINKVVQLSAGVSVWMSSKYWEILACPISDVKTMTKIFSSEQILRMEVIIFETLGHRACGVWGFSFLDEWSKNWSLQSGFKAEEESMLTLIAKMALNITMLETIFKGLMPTEIAGIALWNAVLFVHQIYENVMWTAVTVKLTQFNIKEHEVVCKNVFELLVMMICPNNSVKMPSLYLKLMTKWSNNIDAIRAVLKRKNINILAGAVLRKSAVAHLM